jgi:hypothetical protein
LWNINKAFIAFLFLFCFAWSFVIIGEYSNL